MVLGIIFSETNDFLGHAFRQKMYLDTSSMVIRPVIFVIGKCFCMHLLLYFMVLIYLSASGICLHSDMGFNVAFNYAIEIQMWSV